MADPGKTTRKLGKKKKKSKIHKGRLAILIAAFALVIAAAGAGVYGIGRLIFSSFQSETRSTDVNGAILPFENHAPTTKNSLVFTGVGDNLLHDRLFTTFEEKYGNREFLKQYDALVPYLEKSNLNYINLETLLAGNAYGFSGYPAFNGPSEYFDALAKAGFNWISAASNHTLDMGDQAVKDELAYAREHVPNVSVTGIHDSQENADTPVVREINGIKVGLATFTFGQNANAWPADGWLIDAYRNPDYSINYDLLDARLDALNAASDVQIISVHWGTEYETVPNEEQKTLAAYFHSKGVEAVIGTHPHVIQPVEMIHDENQETLVYYSLGNLLSGQDTNDRMVGGMASFQLNYDPETQKASFEDVRFIPTVTLINDAADEFGVTVYDDYTDEQGTTHYITTQKGLDMSKAWITDYVHSVMGESTEDYTICIDTDPAWSSEQKSSGQ